MEDETPSELARSSQSPTESTSGSQTTSVASNSSETSAEPGDEPSSTSRGTYPGRENLPDPFAVDGSNPLVFLNDQSTDNYMGELALAMADSGTGDLRAFLLGFPREVWKNERKYGRHHQESVVNHRRMHRKATESGLENLPQPEFGLFEHHAKPASGVIEDTVPIGSVGTNRIVELARQATPTKPVVIAAGGDVCTVADAYLSDPSIADSLVVYWHEQVDDIHEQSGYNIQNSGWSAYVVLSRLSVVLDHNSGGFTITRAQVRDRIPSPMDEYMLTKSHWRWGNPLRSTDWSKKWEHEAGDEKALILAAFPYTRKNSRRLKVTGLQAADWNYEAEMVLPTLAPGPSDSKLVQIPKIGDSDRAFWSAWDN